MNSKWTKPKHEYNRDFTDHIGTNESRFYHISLTIIINVFVNRVTYQHMVHMVHTSTNQIIFLVVALIN